MQVSENIETALRKCCQIVKQISNPPSCKRGTVSNIWATFFLKNQISAFNELAKVQPNINPPPASVHHYLTGFHREHRIYRYLVFGMKFIEFISVVGAIYLVVIFVIAGCCNGNS